mgnify:CR=1 FL=1
MYPHNSHLYHQMLGIHCMGTLLFVLNYFLPSLSPFSFFFPVLYSFVALFAFLLMPFVYFYFEEKDEDVTTRQVSKCCHKVTGTDLGMVNDK